MKNDYETVWIIKKHVADVHTDNVYWNGYSGQRYFNKTDKMSTKDLSDNGHH